MNEIGSWYFVTFDEDKITLKTDDGSDEILWKDITRICYRPMLWYGPDEIFIFTNKREDSYLIPSEALGGAELWGEIIDRELFDPDLGVNLHKMEEMELYCWPEPSIEELEKGLKNEFGSFNDV